MTRRHAYLWLTAALLMVLLIVVLIGMHHRDDAPAAQAEVSTTKEAISVERSEHRDMTAARQVPQTTRQPAARQETQPISTERPPATNPRKEKQLRFDLNSADSTDLVQLYNIGPTFARRIIRYRSQLGGFVDKRQLWEVKGIDSVRYNDIAPYLYVNSGDITPIDLNSATIDELKRHPYLDYYQAKAIVQLRDANGPYQQTEEILNIPLIDKETYTHIAPYLTCNSQPKK